MLVRIVIFFTVLFLSSLLFWLSLDYYTPNFEKGFLIDKEHAFLQGIFPVGLYAHIISFPFVVLLTSILIFLKTEIKFPKFHKALGKISALILLFVFLPSGVILSFWGIGGMLTTINFVLLSILTAFFLILAIKHVEQKNITLHKRNMIRMYLLVLSAIFLRIISFVFGYYFGFRGVEAYQTAAVLSWGFPLLVFEIIRLKKKVV